MVGVELDPLKVKSCLHNAGVYKVRDRLQVITADVYDVLRLLARRKDNRAGAEQGGVESGGGGNEEGNEVGDSEHCLRHDGEKGVQEKEEQEEDGRGGGCQRGPGL